MPESDDRPTIGGNELAKKITKAAKTMAVFSTPMIDPALFGFDPRGLRVVLEQVVNVQLDGATRLSQKEIMEFTAKVFLLGVIYARQELGEMDGGTSG